MDDDRWREQLRESGVSPAYEPTQTVEAAAPAIGRERRRLLLWTGLLLVVIAVTVIAVFVGLGFARQDSFALSLDEAESEAGTWTQLPLSGSGGNVNSFAIDPNNPAVVYAATENGVFKSVDAAASWTQVMKSGLSLQSLEVTVFPDAASTLFVTNSGFVTDSVLMRSSDGGASWENLSWDGIVASSWNSRTIGLFDLGAGPFMYVTDASAIDRDPDVNKDKAHIWCSYDKGDTWVEATGADRQKIEEARDASKDYVEAVDPETGAKLLSFIPAVHDPGDASIVYAGTQAGVYKSVDGGTTWARTSEGLAAPAVAGLVFDPVDPAVVYATTEQGVFKSTDAGRTWIEVLEGGSADLISTGPSLVVAPSSPGTLYSWTVAGLFRSDDCGNSWSRLSARGLLPADSDSGAVMYAQLGPVASGDANVLLASADSGVLRTTDGGRNWSHVLGEAGKTATAQMERDPNAPSTVYATLLQVGLKSGADAVMAEAAKNDEEDDLTGLVEQKLSVLRSTDDGATWSELAPEYFTGLVVDFDVDPYDSSTLYAIHSVSDKLSLSEPFTLSRSRDGGRTWTRLRADAGRTYFLSQLVLDARKKGTLYVLASTMMGTGIYRSTDSGASWSDITGNLAGTIVTRLYVDPATEAGLYVTSAKGLYRWTPDSE